MHDDLTVKVTAFIRENLWPADLTGEISETTRLLETGVLDSLKTAMLLNYLRDDLGVRVPPLMIVSANFQDAQSIAALVRQLRAAQGSG